ncbi:hypothetical protein ES703_122818 [subsurface metagenome]
MLQHEWSYVLDQLYPPSIILAEVQVKLVIDSPGALVFVVSKVVQTLDTYLMHLIGEGPHLRLFEEHLFVGPTPVHTHEQTGLQRPNLHINTDSEQVLSDY